MEVFRKLDPNKRHFFFGNVPSLEGTPNELIACSFHWYAVSACNYAWLVGWLREATKPNSPTAKDYRDSVLPKEVITWRDKVAGHFARADNDKRDNSAERMASTLFPFGFNDDVFYASPMKLTTTQCGSASDSGSMSRWSLTKVHEELRKRYWPSP